MYDLYSQASAGGAQTVVMGLPYPNRFFWGNYVRPIGRRIRFGFARFTVAISNVMQLHSHHFSLQHEDGEF